jgi:hypothetical protein
LAPHPNPLGRRDGLQQTVRSAVIAGHRLGYPVSIVFIPFLLILFLGVAQFFVGSVRTKRAVSADRAAHQKRLRLVGAGILTGGLLIAASIDMQAVLDDAAQQSAPGADRRQFQLTFAPAETKRSELAQEMVTGKAGVLGTEVTQWVLSLGHGRRLAYTVAVVSVAGFLICLFLAHPHLADPQAPETPGGAPGA